MEQTEKNICPKKRERSAGIADNIFMDGWIAHPAIARPTGGTYIKNRVFFKDEQTAYAAGYRPCAVCMREHYKLWKEGKLEEALK